MTPVGAGWIGWGGEIECPAEWWLLFLSVGHIALSLPGTAGFTKARPGLVHSPCMLNI